MRKWFKRDYRVGFGYRSALGKSWTVSETNLDIPLFSSSGKVVQIYVSGFLRQTNSLSFVNSKENIDSRVILCPLLGSNPPIKSLQLLAPASWLRN